MKHLKITGLAMMAAAALMAFAGSASATVLTSPSGTEYTGTLESTATASLKLEAGFATPAPTPLQARVRSWSTESTSRSSLES